VIRPRPAGEPAPLSFAQEQVWLHEQMTGDIPFYNETMTISRRGPLDVAVLKRCLLEIIRRHEIWRTTFDVADGQPVQIVHPVPQDFPLAIADLRKLPEAERNREAARLATIDARRRFDLTTGPLLRALLVCIDDEQYRLFMTVHQIVFDAVTAYRVFLPELAALYEAFSSGKPSPLAELQLQYGDFAYRQRTTSQATGGPEHIAYWREQLSGELAPLAWPDRPRPAVATHRGAIERFSFPESLLHSLRALSQQEGVSSYVTLLTGFAALLHRYTGQESIVLGTFTAGRKLAEIEPLAGYFVNPLTLRVDVSGNPTFRELQSRVQAVVLDALAHDDLPFVELLREIQHRPDPSRNPLFQIALSQQPRLPNLAAGWDLATEEVSNGAASWT